MVTERHSVISKEDPIVQYGSERNLKTKVTWNVCDLPLGRQ